MQENVLRSQTLNVQSCDPVTLQTNYNITLLHRTVQEDIFTKTYYSLGENQCQKIYSEAFKITVKLWV